ncbi:MAG: hypothetical protein GY851_24595 [bacterium]|nr:hypothetical protein [bacterium]
MAFAAAFAEKEIAPPLGVSKIGWIKDIRSDTLLDPLYVRVALLESGTGRLAFVQLDTLRIDWADVCTLRQRIAETYDFPGDCIMVSATHNHAGPAIASAGAVKRDDAYAEATMNTMVEVFGEALARMQDAEIGCGSCFEFNVAHNRRIMMRDGTVRTHGTFKDPEALCFEGPIDPEVAVMAVRAKDGGWLGALVNFACHPTHHAGTTELSGGYPAALAVAMKQRGCPVTLFLNGACGNLHHANPMTNTDTPKEDIARILAEDASRLMESVELTDDVALASASRMLALPYRDPSSDEQAGKIRGAQRFVDPGLYDMLIPDLLERIRRDKILEVELQAHAIGNHVLVAVPAELFVQLGLRIKTGAHPWHALVVGYANGSVGYVPHREAFARGGYETTFGPSSQLAPEAGDLIVQGTLGLIGEIPATVRAEG